jgi:hypothetical protein
MVLLLYHGLIGRQLPVDTKVDLYAGWWNFGYRDTVFLKIHESKDI